MSRYNGNVRIGNWFYELIFQEEKQKRYARSNTDLKVQKVRKLFLSLLKEVPLTFPVVGLSYGAVIQIVSPEVPPETIFKIQPKQGLALAADIDFKNIDHRCTFAMNDPVIGTGLLTPCVRNVWTLVPDDKSSQGKELRYGDSFHIKLFSGDSPLFVEAPKMSPGAPKGESGHVMAKLVGWTTTLTRFKVVNPNPRLRYETEGSVVSPSDVVAIMQAATSENLAVETGAWFPTYFGMECEVSVFTYRNDQDRNKPDPRNFWRFVLSA